MYLTCGIVLSSRVGEALGEGGGGRDAPLEWGRRRGVAWHGRRGGDGRRCTGGGRGGAAGLEGGVGRLLGGGGGGLKV